ncbi:hypothetical protein Q6272_28370, partial [Klebsiella pneumoniae]
MLFFYPFIVDSIGFIGLILSDSRTTYQAVQFLGELIAVCVALWNAKRAIPKLTNSFGISIYIPAALLIVVSATCFVRGNDNSAFPLAAL